MKKQFQLQIFIFILCLQGMVLQAMQGELVQVKNLAGSWKFSIGLQDEWKSPNYDDSKWETIRVPGAWEDQGFNGYNGYGTYRLKFTLLEQMQDLYLLLGFIDDVDEVYINGKKIGSTGSFPPNFETAYNAERKYFIPNELLRFNGYNVITVIVYDAYQVGGIASGKIGLFTGKMSMPLDVNLQGSWKFNKGDRLIWKDPTYADNNWGEIFVPAKWEDQGYRDYDGYGWYRKNITIKANLANERLVLIVGKIDDLDEVYVNGILIGSTGYLTKTEGERVNIDGSEVNAFRGYYIPFGLLKPNQTNVIAIRVFDSWGAGGIYEGPVGIITQTKYIAFWRNQKNGSADW